MDDGHKFAFYNRKKKITTAVTNLMVVLTITYYFGGRITRAADIHFALIKFHIYFSLFTLNPGRVSIIIIIHWSNRMQRYCFQIVFFV